MNTESKVHNLKRKEEKITDSHITKKDGDTWSLKIMYGHCSIQLTKMTLSKMTKSYFNNLKTHSPTTNYTIPSLRDLHDKIFH